MHTLYELGFASIAALVPKLEAAYKQELSTTWKDATMRKLGVASQVHIYHVVCS